MKKYVVEVVLHKEVTAESEDEAIDIAFEEWDNELMETPISVAENSFSVKEDKNDEN